MSDVSKTSELTAALRERAVFDSPAHELMKEAADALEAQTGVRVDMLSAVGVGVESQFALAARQPTEIDPKCECGHQALSHPIISGNCIGVDGGRYIVNPPGCNCEFSSDEVRAVVPIEDDQEVVTALNQALTNDGPPAVREKALQDAAVLARRALLSRAAVHDVATELVPTSLVEAVAAERDAALAAVDRVTAERDSAMARIAKAWELHEPFTWSFGYGPVQTCKWCADHGVPQEVASWPCPTVAALDGAPEPEWAYRWGDRNHHAFLDESRHEVFDSHIEAKVAMNRESDRHEDRVFRRRKAGPWLPVEGEGK